MTEMGLEHEKNSFEQLEIKFLEIYSHALMYITEYSTLNKETVDKVLYTLL